MTRHSRKEKAQSKAVAKASVEYISEEDKKVKENQFHHRCSECNKTIGWKAYETKGTCNACYVSDNRENVRRKHSKSKTKKMKRARQHKTTYAMCF